MQAAHSLSTAIVGMEPTGHYWLNVSGGLQREFEVVLVNPHLVKKNKENRDNTPSKSDKKDALVIADMPSHSRILKSDIQQQLIRISFHIIRTISKSAVGDMIQPNVNQTTE